MKRYFGRLFSFFFSLSLLSSPPQSGVGGQGGHGDGTGLFISFLLAGKAMTVEDPLQGGFHHPGRPLVAEPPVGSLPFSPSPSSPLLLGYFLTRISFVLLSSAAQNGGRRRTANCLYMAVGGDSPAHPWRRIAQAAPTCI